MSKPTFIKGFSEKESDAAIAVLEKSNVDYREAFETPAYQSPVLITDNSSFSYKGLASITGYCELINIQSTRNK